MDVMFIFHYHPDLHKIIGKKKVLFVTNDSELMDAITYLNCGLTREEFRGDIPTMTLVERFERRASQGYTGADGNDYVFVNAWQPPVSRSQALEEKYGAFK